MRLAPFAASSLAWVLAASSFAQVPARPAGPPRVPSREIKQIAGDLYRANNGNWYTIFLVTPDGILLGDPISVDFSAWLKGELTVPGWGDLKQRVRLPPHRNLLCECFEGSRGIGRHAQRDKYFRCHFWLFCK